MSQKSAADFPKVTVYGSDFREELSQMYAAITRLGLWERLKEFEPDPKEGYMFTKNPMIDVICSAPEVVKCEHSGATQALCLRHMEVIAKMGWDEYIKKFSN